MQEYIATLEAALVQLRSTRAWAFANAHGCTLGSDPRLDWVIHHERELSAWLEALRGGEPNTSVAPLRSYRP